MLLRAFFPPPRVLLLPWKPHQRTHMCRSKVTPAAHEASRLCCSLTLSHTCTQTTVCSHFVKSLIQLEIIFTLGSRYKMHLITKQRETQNKPPHGGAIKRAGQTWTRRPTSFSLFFVVVYNSVQRCRRLRQLVSDRVKLTNYRNMNHQKTV